MRSICAFTVLLAAAAHAAPIGTTPDMSKATWIWSSSKGIAGGGAVNFFRRSLDLDAQPAEATICITADNGYELYVNGQRIGAELGYSKRAWGTVERFRVEPYMTLGRNVIAIRGESLGGSAGVVAAIHVRCQDGTTLDVVTDASWLAARSPKGKWASLDYDDSAWKPAAAITRMGGRPWGMLTPPNKLTDAKKLVVDNSRPGQISPQLVGKLVPPGEGFEWPRAVVFLKGKVSKRHHFAFQYRLPNGRRKAVSTRAYPENDVSAPSVVGRQMYALAPAKPGAKPKLLLDAGKGTIGSPSVSYDGKTLYFSMAPEGDGFYHLYRMPADGGQPVALTAGPFHDYDPEPLPDGRIAFSSTRIGSREEYHGSLASCLFAMNADGSNIQPLTYHIVADREPRVLANGALVAVRSDNFLERAKVETRLHQMRMDATDGVTLMGNDRQPLTYNRGYAMGQRMRPGLLRAHGFGSTAPLPDGRVAALSAEGLVLSDSARGEGRPIKTSAALFDVSPLPDGRLLATTLDRKWLAVVDLATGNVVGFHNSQRGDVHSPVFLGPRRKPAQMPASKPKPRTLDRTGYLYCQNVFNTRHTQADVKRIKAIRVYAGRPLALRPDHFPYTHIGVDAVELGTVALAPDGSFHARVPADRALALQAVDAEGRPVINELSWIYVRPGERRACTGCHAPRPDAPQTTYAGAALRARPADLLGQGQPHRFRGNNAEIGGFLNLQIERMREAASIDLYTQECIAPSDTPLPPGRPTLVARLIEQLKSSDAGLRMSAARRLAILHDRAAAPALAALLADKQPDVRIAAAVALAACGTREQVAALVKALDDPDACAAQSAHMALEHLTGHSGGRNAFTRRASDWPAIERQLIARLRSNDPQAAISAAQGLGHVAGAAGKAALRTFVARGVADPQGRATDLRALMAATRALGYLRDQEAVGLLTRVLKGDLRKLNRRTTFVAATAAQALGRIGAPAAEAALVDAFTRLADFWYYTRRCGDHPVLVANHSSIIHYRILEALDALGTRSKAVVPAALRSIPAEQDRGLLLERDAYETLVARVVQRSGLLPDVMETCLHVLGDATATASEERLDDVTASPLPQSWGAYTGTPLKALLKRPRGGLAFLPYDKDMRAAQLAAVLTLDNRFAPRLTAAFQRYRAIQAAPDKEYPRARTKAWVCFYLAKALGRSRDQGAVDALLAALNDDPTEASFGYRTPPSAVVYKAITPMYRAAVAYALGEIGDERAAPSLLKVVGDFDNALDVRHSAAQGLRILCNRSHLAELQALAETYPEIMTRRELLRACRAAARRR